MSKKELTVAEETAVMTEVVEMTEEQAEKLVETITNKYNKIDKGFLGIMGDIAKAYDNGIHTYYGYTSFYDMASDRWGIGKTSVKNMVAINRRFGTNYKIGKDWQEYGTSKLLLIKDLSDEQIEELGITADMSREEVSDKVREFKGIGKKDDVVEPTNDGEESTVDREEEAEAMEFATPVEIKVSHETLDLFSKYAEEYADEYKANVKDDFYQLCSAIADALQNNAVNVYITIGD
jgi:hypothetical protein